MTNVAISGLPAATALTGSELVPIVQAGVTRRTTVSAIPGTFIDARSYAIDPTGSSDSSVGGNLAIIDAINQKKQLIWPSGLFKLNGPLIAFTGVQQSFQMYGQVGPPILLIRRRRHLRIQLALPATLQMRIQFSTRTIPMHRQLSPTLGASWCLRISRSLDRTWHQRRLQHSAPGRQLRKLRTSPQDARMVVMRLVAV
jgi:hypothetical protein